MNKVYNVFMAGGLLLALTLTGCTKKKNEAGLLPTAPEGQGTVTTQPETNMVMAPQGGAAGEGDFTLDTGEPDAVPAANPTE